MKYKIDSELRNIAKFKMPASTKVLPAINFVLKCLKCKQDKTVSVQKIQTPGYQGNMLETYVIEPKENYEKLPCMVLFHGGGFMLKSSASHYKIAKWYAQAVQCKVIYTDYRLAPEFSYPIPVEDCYETYKWTIENANLLNIDEKRVIVAGDSAGGNLSAAVSLMARDRGIQMPMGALLIYPTTDRTMSTESMKKYVDTPIWDARLSKMMWNAYLGKSAIENVAYASPIEAETLKDFLATYMEVAEYDCLRDEGILFKDKLIQQGISVDFYEIKGACHGFENAVDSNMLKKAMERRVHWLQKLFRSIENESRNR